MHEELHPPKVKEVPDPRDLVYCQNKNSSLCVQSAVLELELVEWTMKDFKKYIHESLKLPITDLDDQKLKDKTTLVVVVDKMCHHRLPN